MRSLSKHFDESRSRILGAVLLVLLGCLYAGLRLPSTELGLYDESFYLTISRNLNWQTASWSPLYAVYYRLVSWLIFSRLADQIFLAGAFLLCCVAAPLAVYSWVLRLGGSVAAALVAGIWILTSKLSLPMEPHVHEFNFVMVTLVSALVLRRPVRTSMWFAVGFASLMLIFVRSDNIIYIGVFALLLVDDLLERHREGKSVHWQAAFYVIGVVTSAVIFFSLWNSPFGQNRGIDAFIDHFTWRNDQFIRVIAGPNQSLDQATRVFLGNPTSLGEIFRSHYRELQNYFAQNLIDWPMAVWQGLKTRAPFHIDDRVWWSGAISIVIGFFLILAAPSRFKTKASWRLPLFGVIFATALLRTGMVSILLEPWLQYGTDLAFFILIGLALLATSFGRRISFSSRWLTPIWFVSLISWVLAQGLSEVRGFEAQPTTRKLVQQLRLLDPLGSLLLMSEGPCGIYYDWDRYLGTYDYWLEFTKHHRTFSQILADKKVDLVLIGPGFHGWEAMKISDHGISEFERTYDAQGFESIWTLYDHTLYARKELHFKKPSVH